ncbi:MAG: hypothetical protein GX620_03690 [Chloroflexi bacterium]|nr:hypothetical protein [Chloroflexota bacterium]
MTTDPTEARQRLTGKTIWLWHYMHSDWQWTHSRQWHEERYALSVNEALDLMVDDPEFVYFIDNISEFYNPVAQRLGPRVEELKARIREGRVRFASGQIANCRPTQVGDETFIRNIQLGLEFVEENLPPTDLSLFHSVDIAIGGTQMPQLLNQLGFKYYRAWRPHGPMNVLGIPHQFIWQGADGSRILVTRGCYGMVWSGGVWGPETPPVRFSEDWGAVVPWLVENLWHDQLIDDRSPSDHLWMTIGFDDSRPMVAQGDAPFDVTGFVNEWRKREDVPIRVCTPLEYSQAVAEHADRLQVVEGVLDGADVGYNMANHGANGLWMWRQMNDRRLVLAEILAAAAASAGFDSPREELKRLWWEHCTYQAHAQDDGFQADWDFLVDRARSVQYGAERIQERALSAVVKAAGGGTRTTRLVLNPLPWPVEADVEIYHPCVEAGVESLQIVDDAANPLPQQQLAEFRHPRFAGSINDERRLVRLQLPAMGYRRVEIVESAETASMGRTLPQDGIVETADLQLVYRDHALRQVRDRASGRAYSSRDGAPWPNLAFHVLDNQNWLAGGPELRREYFQPESGEWLHVGPMRWQYRSTGMVGPYRAWVDTSVADRGRELQVALRLEGHWDEPPVTGHVILLAEIEAGGVIRVDEPFTVEERDPDHDIYVDNVPTDRDYGITDMFERLRPGVFWGRSWADWSGNGQGLTLISVNGCYYWLKEPHQMGHVALRCVAATPGTWEALGPAEWSGSGTHHFSYVVRFHDGEWRVAEPQRRSMELRYPPIVGRADCPGDPVLPATGHSFLDIDGPVLLSAYYNEGRDSFIRVYEADGTGGTVTVSLDWQPSNAQVVDLRGRAMDVPLDVLDHTVRLNVGPRQIATLKVSRG